MHFPIRMIPPIAAVQLGLTMFAAPAQAAVSNTTKMEADIVSLTNKARASHGCKALRADARLNVSSEAHSVYMARTGAFSHVGRAGRDFAFRMKAANYPRPLAENIAVGFRSGADVVTAWMKSPSHRANLLNCHATAVGVGVIYAASGTVYVTQDFGN